MAISAITVSAQSVALDHEGTSTIFYGSQSLSQAYAQAEDGDILYISGGSYGDLTLEKKLKIYGTGVNPNNTAATGISELSNIYVNAAGAESHIEGVKANNVNLTSAESVTIRYCQISSVDARLSHNLLMYNNIVGVIRLGDTCRDNATQLSTGCVISNNYIQSGINRCRENTIKNNLFRAKGVRDDFNGSGYDYQFVGTACTVENNIFTANSGGYGTWCSGGNTTRKNITYWYARTDDNYGVGSSKDAEIFVDYDEDNFTFDNSFRLKDPTTYVGTDNTQVGLYGGLFPWNEDVMPSNPHIMSNTSGTKTNSEGKLLLNFEVSAQ